jgi:hypothetical protein
MALPRNPLVRVTTAAVLLAAGVLLSPGRAAASCGDYVTIGGQPAHAMPASGDAPAVAPRPPCSGPNCSNRQNSPVAPLQAPVTPPTDPKQLDARPGDADAPDAGRRLWFAEPSGRPVRTSTSIFHPPRSV